LTFGLVSTKLRMCPITTKYRLKFATPEDDKRRAVAFLISNNIRATANTAFKKLSKDHQLWLQIRFEYWISGQRPNKKWFHGWNLSEFQGKYTKCFVFKCREKLQYHRFYGFLRNPKASNPGYQVCVLVIHAYKEGYETDEADLKGVEELRTSPIIIRTIDDYFRGKP